MNTWSRLAGIKFYPTLSRSRQWYKLFINYILRLHVKCFIPAKRDSSFVQPGSHFATTKFSHVMSSARLDEIKNLIKKYPQKYISIDLRYFYCVFTSHMTSNRSSHRRYSTRKFFCNIHRKTPVLESLCGSSSIRFYQRETPTLIFPVNTEKLLRTPILKNILWTTAYFMKNNTAGD